jgi:hypothetical protein
MKRLDAVLMPAPYRALASRLMLPAWPRARLAESRVERIREDVTSTRLGADRVGCLRVSGPLDIDPLSGLLFDDARLVSPQPGEELLPWPQARPDVTRRLRMNPVMRQPLSVLHHGDDGSLAAFCSDVLPRFFALDHLELPQDLLLVVPVSMGMTDRFQDAITDGVFRPRPVELMRQGRVTRSDTVYVIERPLGHAGVLGRIAARLAEVYPADETADAPVDVLLCEGGPSRAERLLAGHADLRAAVPEGRLEVVDPADLPLRALVQRLRRARTLFAPSSGELSAAVLAGGFLQRLVEIAAPSGRTDPRPAVIAAGLGLDLERLASR